MSLYETGIRPIMDKYLLDKAKEKRDYGEFWSASSAGYCMRKNIFERLGVPHVESDSDARKQRVFEAGHVFHQWAQELTKNAGISIAQELELEDTSLMIRGHFDDLVLVPAPDKFGDIMSKVWSPEDEPTVTDNPSNEQHLILYDIKTVNSRSFMWAKKNGNAMSYYHKMQLGTYMYMLRKGLGVFNEFDRKHLGDKPGVITVYEGETAQVKINDLTEARILKIEKENLMMMEQQLLWSQELEEEIVAYWVDLNMFWAEKKIPPCTCADKEGGFMAKEQFNPFFYEGESCSLTWYKKCKAEGLVK